MCRSWRLFYALKTALRDAVRCITGATQSFPSGGALTDVLMYDGKTNKWTKVGDLCTGRFDHGISLVSADMEDYCVLDLDC